MALHGDEIYFLDQNLNNNTEEIQPALVRETFKKFLKEWEVNNEYVYSKQVINNGGLENYYVVVDIKQLHIFDVKLYNALKDNPLKYLYMMEEAARDYFLSIDIRNAKQIPPFHVQLLSDQNPKSLRELKSNDLKKMITIEGIIINVGKVLFKGYKIVLNCKNCNHKKIILQEKGFSGFNIPNYCQGQTTGANTCPKDSYYINPEESEFIDFQIIKIQELPESLPSGEIPRTYQVCLERYLVDTLKPGSPVVLTAVYTLIEKSNFNNLSSALNARVPYLYALGIVSKVITETEGIFTKSEVELFKKFSEKDAYNNISSMIAPAIFGHNDIKKAIACLLFSGSSKILKDKTKLRGDINVLLLGDPSTAKSQFLKFVHKISPISVYTSGKGSSAAGLTAAITRDSQTREFQLEGGALVLADGGVVCIDEFDKMRVQDRVAIHEAMEQQTISISKAGISTVLNSRTSILAAANPIFGVIDDLKTISDQIDLQSTILSRFDCIFLVKDLKSTEHDKNMAMHIMNLHTKEGNTESSEIDNSKFKELKNYILYAKLNVNPRLNEEAANTLQNYYISDRKNVIEKRNAKKSHIPVTVRQLEAIIRLSEALAKMRLSEIVTKDDVEEAHRLFTISTMNTINAGISHGDKSLIVEIQQIENLILNKLKPGDKIVYSKLLDDIKANFKNTSTISKAIHNLIKKDILKHLDRNDIVIRQK